MPTTSKKVPIKVPIKVTVKTKKPITRAKIVKPAEIKQAEKEKNIKPPANAVNFIAPEPKKEEPKTKKNFSLGIYKKIAFSFIVLTLILIGVVLYFSLIKLNIIIVPKEEAVASSLAFDIYASTTSENLPAGAIVGEITKIKEVETKEFSATGIKSIGADVTGKVTIINNYNRNQPLVATTRLLTSDNKLFRLKNTINVPAGSSVEAEIYADSPAEDIDIPPSKFSFPGLWAGLQDKIYAESKEAIKYQEQVKKVVTEKDIEDAAAEIKNSLATKAKADAESRNTDFNIFLYKIDEDSIKNEIDSKAGDEKEKFMVTAEAEIAVIAFKGDQANSLANEKLSSELPANKELLGLNFESFKYDLNSVSFEQNTASASVSFEGKTIFKKDAEIIDRNKIVGLDKEQIITYLDSLPDIASYQIIFSPKFIDRAPNLVDRITVKID